MPEITVSEAYEIRQSIIANGGKLYLQKGSKRFLVTFRTDVPARQNHHITDDSGEESEQVHYRLFVHDRKQIPVSFKGSKKLFVEYPESS